MIKLFLVFGESGIEHYAYKAQNSAENEDSEISEELVASLLTALSMFAKEVVSDEISKIELKGHVVVFQKRNFSKTDEPDWLTFALIGKQVDLDSPLNYARLKGLLVRLLLLYASRYHLHTPYAPFRDKGYDRFVKGEIRTMNRRLNDLPHPQIAIRFKCEIGDIPGLREVFDLTYNKLCPAFISDFCTRFEAEQFTQFFGDLESFYSFYMISPDFSKSFAPITGCAIEEKQFPMVVTVKKSPQDIQEGTFLTHLERWFTAVGENPEIVQGVNRMAMQVNWPSKEYFKKWHERNLKSMNHFLQIE